MKRTLFILISAVLTGCLLTACWKTRPFLSTDNPYGLPNATQTGADIFAFRLDSTNMVYKFPSGFSDGPRPYLTGTYKNDTLLVSSPVLSPASKYDNAGFLSFKIQGNVNSGRIYNLADTAQISFFYYVYFDYSICIPQNNAQPFHPKTGTFTLTKLDVVNRIMSGRFDNINFSVNNCTGIDTLHVTDGRFDTHY